MIEDTYRPTRFDAMVGNERAVKLCRALAAKCQAGDPIVAVLSGPSGTGKTTAALIMARAIAGRNVTTVDSGDLDARHVADLAPIVRKPRRPMLFEDPPAVVIIEEIHTASKGAVQKLLSVLEDMRPHTAVIMTANLKPGQLFNRDCAIYERAFSRRVVPVDFTQEGIATRNGGKPGPGPRYVKACMAAEGMDGRPMSYYVRLFKGGQGNIGQALVDAWRDAMEREEMP